MNVTFYSRLYGILWCGEITFWLFFAWLKICKVLMAPKNLPVINNFRLPNHNLGLNCLSIRANCLPTSKEELLREEQGTSQKRHAGQANQPFSAVAWRSQAKLLPQNCCLPLSWCGASIPQSLPAEDTESLFTFRFLKWLPGSGWGQTPQWCIEEHVWEFLSHLKHIPENEEEDLAKISRMRRRLYCSLFFSAFIIFFFSWHSMFY